MNQKKRIEQAAQCPRDKLLVRLLSHLGCRVSEALGIAVSDIDFDQNTITIVYLKRRIKLSCPQVSRERLSRTAQFCLGCGFMLEKAVADEREHRRQRVLPIDEDTLIILKEYITRHGPVKKNGNHGFRNSPNMDPTRAEITRLIVQFFSEHLQ